MTTLSRRYDIDWIRVIAIGLLVIYHVAVGFQPWGVMLQFVVTPDPWESLWLPMSIINVWRIPLLFFVSGMGVYFALRKRNWRQLITERSRRILLPFLFGMFFIVPIHVLIWQNYYKMSLSYSTHPGHLWFLANIFIYVVILSPVFIWLKRNEDGNIVRKIKCLISSPLGIFGAAFAFVAEAVLFNPRPYEMYAMTWHGFFLGLIAFFFGFCFVLSGKPFWQMILKWRLLFLSFGILLFVLRLTFYYQYPPIYLVAIESISWITAVLGLGYKYLNRPGKTLSYLSQAAYPVYIIHMICLYAGSALIFKIDVAAPVQFILLLIFTFVGCFLIYEFMIRRIKFIRPLFGLRPDKMDKENRKPVVAGGN